MTATIGTPALLVLRGNSGSGKTTAAREVRHRYGRGAAGIEQDQFRREVLREHGGLGDDAVAPGFIAMSVQYLLTAGYHVIVEGILHTESYGQMLRKVIAEHPGPSHVFYLASVSARRSAGTTPGPSRSRSLPTTCGPGTRRTTCWAWTGNTSSAKTQPWSRPSPRSWTAAVWRDWRR